MTASTARLTAAPLGVVAGLIAAALLILGAYTGHDVTAYAGLLAGLVLAWGWPVLLDLPRPPGTSAVLAVGALGAAGIVAFSGDGEDGMRALSVVLAIALVLAFLHELLRTDGRHQLVVSLAGSALGLALLASGAFYAGAASHPFGDHAVAVVAGASALGLVAEALLGRGASAEWVLPVGLLLGAAVGVLVGIGTDGHWNVLLIAGLVAAAVATAVRRVLSGLPATEPAARLAYGAAAVLSTGVVAYAAQWAINR
ncbi:hypothetical protein HJ588_00990 [Flexivirga sp. ID2601S]|uniref:Uncharacterized protein n=1 Tax=Flexivirga aerilata TaxID=1656889 RepID=A0A849AF46_9MICO|nr:hypothetical protein [Flexivirga aerilata]NNG37851.1 hypothetical protein [Flexivirga aerilata]